MEELRLELYKSIELYGPLDPRTVELSQRLDIFIVESMVKKNRSLEPKN